jgi:hypothetical protein
MVGREDGMFIHPNSWRYFHHPDIVTDRQLAQQSQPGS